MVGLSLGGFCEFIDSHGGRDAFIGLSTSDVKRQFLLPSTATTKSSYADVLQRLGSPHVGTANKFISHVYASPFLKIVDAIGAWEARQDVDESLTYFYYFDLFVVNQHGQGAVVPFEVLRDEFGGGVRAIGHTLLCMEWAEAAALKRMWCVFELYTTLACDATLDILMAPEDQAEFLEALTDAFESLVYKTTVDAETAQAHVPEDDHNIRRAITESVGFMKLNQMIIGAMRDWMVAQGADALLERREELGDDDPDTLHLMENLGNLLVSQGKLAAAEQLFAEARAAYRRIQGDDGPDALNATNSLAAVVQSQGRLDEAEALYRYVVTARKRIVDDADEPEGGDGVDAEDSGPVGCDKETLSSLTNLATLLHAKGQTVEAGSLFREALDVQTALYGPEHPDTLSSANSLAALLASQGMYEDAEPLYRDTLEKRRMTLGDEHPHTLRSMNNMANLLHSLGRDEEAEPLLAEAIGTCRRTLGNEHPDTLSCANDMGVLLESQGQLAAAEALFRSTLAARRHVLGDSHHDTLESVTNLASLLHNRKAFSEAEELYRLAVISYRLSLGEDHPSTLESMHSLAVHLATVGKLEDAEPLFAEALGAQRSTLGPTHADTQRTASNLSRLLTSMGRLEEAETVLRGPSLSPVAGSRHSGAAAGGRGAW